MIIQVAGSVIELTQGDITESDTDAIVNAANSQLQLGAGVAGTIRNKGGPQIQEECDAIGHCPSGRAVLTTGGRLKARYIIHAVGPRMSEGEENEKLRNATLHSLQCADKHQLASLAFPAISTGIFGFPLDSCARIMLGTVHEYLSGKTGIKKVVFSLFDEQAYGVFAETARSVGGS